MHGLRGDELPLSIDRVAVAPSVVPKIRDPDAPDFITCTLTTGVF